MRVLILTAALLIAPTAFAAGPQRHHADAPLRALQFVDANEGWSVGDEGAIWHTIDGGTTWERQSSGVTGSLQAVSFVNPFTGWAVGREELPNGGGSSGVILITSDGGLKWTRVAQHVLPGLHAVKFFDGKNGIVAGEGSDALPSGVFTTSDGGLSWRPVSGPRPPGWLAADFSDIRTGALAGAWSSLAIMRENVFGKGETETFGGRNILGIRIYRDTAFAVGQGGLILKSEDTAGGKWRVATPKCLSADALASCDLHAVHVIGEHVWVAGRPGTFILHSSDYGKNWEMHSTGQNLPLHGLYFTDSTTGWAVGDFGTILGTVDGGKTWKVQRRGGERAAALFVHATGETLPLETIAHYGADDGYLTAAVRLFAPDPATAPVRRASDPHRFSAAVRLAGGAAGECLWPFSLPSHHAGRDEESLLAALDARQNQLAGDMILRQLVLTLRLWQPEVVVSDQGISGFSQLAGSAVKEAFDSAADPKVFPEQISELGLKPWSAKKLYFAGESGTAARGKFDLVVTEPLPRIGDSARDLATPAASLLYDGPGKLPTKRQFALQASRLPEAESHVNLMQGINLAHGGTARREQQTITQLELTALEERTRFVQIRRNIEALANSDMKAIGGPDRLLGPTATARTARLARTWWRRQMPLTGRGPPAASSAFRSTARGAYPVRRSLSGRNLPRPRYFGGSGRIWYVLRAPSIRAA